MSAKKSEYCGEGDIPGILFIMFLVWLKGIMLLKPALLLPGLYMLYVHVPVIPPRVQWVVVHGVEGGRGAGGAGHGWHRGT